MAQNMRNSHRSRMELPPLPRSQIFKNMRNSHRSRMEHAEQMQHYSTFGPPSLKRCNPPTLSGLRRWKDATLQHFRALITEKMQPSSTFGPSLLKRCNTPALLGPHCWKDTTLQHFRALIAEKMQHSITFCLQRPTWGPVVMNCLFKNLHTVMIIIIIAIVIVNHVRHTHRPRHTPHKYTNDT